MPFKKLEALQNLSEAIIKELDVERYENNDESREISYLLTDFISRLSEINNRIAKEITKRYAGKGV